MPISITSPQAAIAAAPYLIGFTPRNSMVLMLTTDQGRSLGMRVDLPARPEIGWIQSIVNGIQDPVPPTTMLLAYADPDSEDLVTELSSWLTNVLSPLTDVVVSLLIGPDSARSLAGGLAGSHPAEIDMREVRNHPIIAECVAAGMTCLSDRDELVAQLEPVSDEVSSRVLAQLRTGAPRVVDYERSRDLLERRALTLLQGTQDLSPADVVCLALACRDCHVRDPLLAIVLSPQSLLTQPLRQLRTRLMYAVNHLPDTHAGPVAATLALVAWADGDGASALVAAQRAMDLDPRNTLAPLVADALSHGLPPDTWASLTDGIPMEVLRGQSRRSA